MTRLRPLLETSGDDLERALLRSVQRASPGRSGLQDTALALGLAAPTAKALADALAGAESLQHVLGVHSGAGAASAAATTATGTASAAGAGSSASGAAFQATVMVIGKYLAGGALASLLAMTTLDQALRFGPPSTPAEPALLRSPTAAPGKPNRLAPRQAPSKPLVERPEEEGAVRAALVPTSTQPTGKAAPKRTRAMEPAPAALLPPVQIREAASPEHFATVQSSPSAAQPTAGAANNPSLAAEIQLLDRARVALARGDGEGARRLLDQYATNRPTGVLAQEAALLRVRLLLKLGKRHAAAELARQIIGQNPESRHVDSLLDLAKE